MNNKGQAFSTFKLLIAAVVAVAILGILLSILEGMTNPVGFDQQAKNLLQEVSGSSSIQQGPEVSISEALYKGEDFQGAAKGNPVEFVCKKPLCGWESGDTLSGEDSIMVDTEGSAKLAACCTDSTCYLGIGTSVQDLNTNFCG